ADVRKAQRLVQPDTAVLQQECVAFAFPVILRARQDGAVGCGRVDPGAERQRIAPLQTRNLAFVDDLLAVELRVPQRVVQDLPAVYVPVQGRRFGERLLPSPLTRSQLRLKPRPSRLG